MNKREENKLSMFNSVVALLDDNPDKIAAIPVIGETLSAFKNILEEIKTGDLEFAGKTKDETADKNIKEETLHSRIFKIASALYVLGIKTKNTDLIVNAKVTKTEMELVRDNVLCSKCLEILTKATQYSADLVNYSITAEMVTEAQAALEDFQSALAKQAGAFTDITASRIRLTELMEEANGLLKDELDPMMELFAESESVFYNEYQNARVIKDLGVRHSATTT